MSKEYNITTLNDIALATSAENIDNFLTDLKGVLLLFYLAREVANDTGEPIEFGDNMRWIDDNEHKITVNLHEKEEQTIDQDTNTWVKMNERNPPKRGTYWVHRAGCNKSNTRNWLGDRWNYDGNVITHWLSIPEVPKDI